MFARTNHRLDFADTRGPVLVGCSAERPAACASGKRLESADALEPQCRADEADGTLLGLVLCAALATLVLSMAASLSF